MGGNSFGLLQLASFSVPVGPVHRISGGEPRSFRAPHSRDFAYGAAAEVPVQSAARGRPLRADLGRGDVAALQPMETLAEIDADLVGDRLRADQHVAVERNVFHLVQPSIGMPERSYKQTQSARRIECARNGPSAVLALRGPQTIQAAS